MAGAGGLLKRLSDIVFSTIALMCLSPVLCVIAIAIHFDSPGPIIFRQRRVGAHGREFTMWKFRTMKIGTPDIPTHLLTHPDRLITRVGRWLRRTSLDELPQLVNILGGRMSVVGPRPALYNQMDLIAMRKAKGIDVLRPGLTGWAQINGRDDLTLVEKVEWEAEYMRRWSLLFDVYIVAKTIGQAISGRGVRA